MHYDMTTSLTVENVYHAKYFFQIWKQMIYLEGQIRGMLVLILKTAIWDEWLNVVPPKNYQYLQKISTLLINLIRKLNLEIVV